jgi:hypothetical protein
VFGSMTIRLCQRVLDGLLNCMKNRPHLATSTRPTLQGETAQVAVRYILDDDDPCRSSHKRTPSAREASMAVSIAHIEPAEIRVGLA